MCYFQEIAIVSDRRTIKRRQTLGDAILQRRHSLQAPTLQNKSEKFHYLVVMCCHVELIIYLKFLPTASVIAAASISLRIAIIKIILASTFKH